MQQMATGYSSLQKALEILLSFTPNNHEIGTSELARNLGLNKSTVSRLLQVLAAYGFVKKNDATQKYSLGSGAISIGRAAIRYLNDHLVTIAQPFIDELRDRIGESVALEILSGKSTILACRARGARRVNVSTEIGDKLPMHVTAGAKAILAFSSSDFVDSVLEKKLKRLTPNTITDPDVFKRHLRESKELGVAFDKGERDIDVYAVAAPIFNHEGKPIAAVIVPSPKNRFETTIKPNIIAQLKETAATISTQLHYSQDDEEKIAS